MYAPLSQASRLLCATILALVLLAAPAYADAPFTPRFAQTLKGDIAAVGNTLMTCPASAACTTAQNATASGNALNNNNYVMGYVDVDADATTFDSSSATVSLPAGSTVLWAGLYWAADTTPGTSGVAAPTPASRGTVRLKAGAGAYQTVTAAPADVLASVSQANRYRGFADVTTAVAAAGSGTYTVANVQAGTGNDRFAGWALLIAYRDTTQAVRGLHVYDGLGTVDATHTFQTTVAPFHTPVSPAPVTTKVGLLSFEGDAGLANETATFNAVALTDALNPANNAMNSTIESAGTAFTAKSPNYANQLGMDLDVFPNLGALTNNQTSASLYFSSTNEYYMPSAFFLVSDEGPATVSVPPSVTPPGGGGPAQDGQTLSANPGSWNATGTPTYTYQWQRCDAAGNSCQDIPGATNSTYTPTAADVGGTVRVVVTATNAAGATSSVSAPIAIAAAPPVNTAPPALPGPATQGQPLQADAGNWTGTGPVTHTYQWQRCDAAGNNCQDVAGATGSSYTPGAEDVGGTVRVVVTSTNSVGSSVSASAPVAVAPPVPPVSIAPPVLWGPVAQGQPLTVDPGAWAGGGTSYSYAWQRCDADGNGCTDIPGATDATYTPGADDVGHVLRAVVTATNDAGSTTTTTAPSPAVVAASDPAAEDLAGIAGGLIGQASCQQLVGGAKYRRVALTGIGTVRVRAYTSGPALRSSPVRLTTEISGGRARGVRYLLDGRAVGAATGSRHAATLTPSQLGNVGVHTLRTAVRGRRGAVRTVVLTLRTEPCQVLFTAQRWRTTAGAGLRLRVDSRTALSQLSFAVPSVLLPRQGAQPRVAGFIRLYVGGRTRPLRYNLSLRRRGATPTLLSGPGRPTVSLRRGGLRVTGLPARAAVAEVTLYRVTKLDRATPQRAYTLRASVARAAGMPETFSAKPRAQR